MRDKKPFFNILNTLRNHREKLSSSHLASTYLTVFINLVLTVHHEKQLNDTILKNLEFNYYIFHTERRNFPLTPKLISKWFFSHFRNAKEKYMLQHVHTHILKKSLSLLYLCHREQKEINYMLIKVIGEATLSHTRLHSWHC